MKTHWCLDASQRQQVVIIFSGFFSDETRIGLSEKKCSAKQIPVKLTEVTKSSSLTGGCFFISIFRFDCPINNWDANLTDFTTIYFQSRQTTRTIFPLKLLLNAWNDLWIFETDQRHPPVRALPSERNQSQSQRHPIPPMMYKLVINSQYYWEFQDCCSLPRENPRIVKSRGCSNLCYRCSALFELRSSAFSCSTFKSWPGKRDVFLMNLTAAPKTLWSSSEGYLCITSANVNWSFETIASFCNT